MEKNVVNCATFNLSCTAGNKTNKKKEDKNEYFIIFQYSINIKITQDHKYLTFKKKKKKKLYITFTLKNIIYKYIYRHITYILSIYLNKNRF